MHTRNLSPGKIGGLRGLGTIMLLRTTCDATYDNFGLFLPGKLDFAAEKGRIQYLIIKRCAFKASQWHATRGIF